jgi:hypothetical protein
VSIVRTDTCPAFFPDLVDVVHAEVYEIKPNSPSNFILGEAQLEVYLKLFNALDPQKRTWKEGSDYTPPISFAIEDPTTGVPTLVVVQPPVFGVILYSTLTDFIENRAKNVSEMENGQIEDDFNEAVELDSL